MTYMANFTHIHVYFSIRLGVPGRTVRADIRLNIRNITDVRVELSVQPRISAVNCAPKSVAPISAWISAWILVLRISEREVYHGYPWLYGYPSGYPHRQFNQGLPSWGKYGENTWARPGLKQCFPLSGKWKVCFFMFFKRDFDFRLSSSPWISYCSWCPCTMCCSPDEWMATPPNGGTIAPIGALHSTTPASRKGMVMQQNSLLVR